MNSVKIYYGNIHSLPTEERMKECLSKERLEKAACCRQEADKKRSLAAGLLFAYGLKKQGFEKEDTTIVYGENGKPKFRQELGLFFNVTHAGDYAAVAFFEEEIGIDLEKVREKKEKLAERFFAKEEQTFLHNNWSDEAFTKIWTRKESFVKACGIGMKLDFSSFSTLEDRICWQQDTYFFQTIQPEKKYFLSVCTKGKNTGIIVEKVNLAEL